MKCMYVYGTMVATSCDWNAPRCTTKVPRVRLHGSRGGVFVGHRPLRHPGDPRQYMKKGISQKFHIYSDVTHAHTPTQLTWAALFVLFCILDVLKKWEKKSGRFPPLPLRLQQFGSTALNARSRWSPWSPTWKALVWCPWAVDMLALREAADYQKFKPFQDLRRNDIQVITGCWYIAVKLGPNNAGLKQIKDRLRSLQVFSLNIEPSGTDWLTELTASQGPRCRTWPWPLSASPSWSCFLPYFALDQTLLCMLCMLYYCYSIYAMGYAIVRLFFLKRHWVKTMHSWILVAGLAVFLFLLAITRIALGVEHRNLGCNRSRATL